MTPDARRAATAAPARKAAAAPATRRMAMLAAAAAGLLAAPGALGIGAASTNASAESAAAAARGFQFGVIGHLFKTGPDEALLRQAIAGAAQANPAFIVATGIKAGGEPCGDRLYAQRRALLGDAAAPMIVSLAGSDWSACLNSAGRSNAIERLNRLRELFYADGESLGARRLALTRLSSTAKFRGYAENAHWEYGKVLFATINLPANNNHYLPEAGRNSEYEDRLVANRAWLHRLFTLAARQKLHGLVLFSDGDIGLQKEEKFSLLPRFQAKQDGFAEPRRQIRALAEKFKGQVLLIDAQGTGEPAIAWRGNLGHLGLAAQWAEVRVTPGGAALFSVRGAAAEAAPQPQPPQ